MAPGSAPEAVSVVVPVYNSQGTLRELVERLERVLGARGLLFEILLIDDDSSDESWRCITDLARQRGAVSGVRLMRNFGQHSAVLAGVRRARFPLVVTLDDDLQHRVEDIPALLDKLREGHDVVYGMEVGEAHGAWRRLASVITRLVLQDAMGVEVARHISNFRAFRAPLREAFAEYSSPFVSVDVLLTWGTTRFAMVPVTRDRRAVGRSNYTFRKLAAHALNMATGFSTAPLQFASVVGFTFMAVGFIAFAYVVVAYFVEGSSVPGFPFLASLVAILSGAQLFALGIIGEYLARTHVRTMRRPTYVERETTDGDDPLSPQM